MRFTHANAFDTATVTIANGASLSDALNCGGLRLFAILLPASWTTANITLQVRNDGGTTWKNLHDSFGSEYTIIAAADRLITLNAADLAAFQHIRLRSGTATTAVNQGADRIITCLMRSI